MKTKVKITSTDVFDYHRKLKPHHLKPVCDDILRNVIRIGGRYEPVQLSEENFWSENPYDRSWHFKHHCFISVAQLLDGYKAFREEVYLEKALALILDWYAKNPEGTPIEMAWHDHTTAWRLMAICKFYVVWEEYHYDGATADKLVEIIETHCRKLADDDFYMPRHNHGMDQDIALYVASTLIPGMKEDAVWEKKAMKRFWEQITAIFADDGSYLEHSPQYIFLLLTNILSFIDYVREVNPEEYAPLQKWVDPVLKHLVYVTQPDGTFPAIGDSERVDLHIDNWKVRNPDMHDALQFLASKGKDGSIGFNLDGFYFDAGVAALRNQWEYDDSTVQMLFYSGFHSRVHKHHDDLAFTIFAHGQPVFIDAGKHSYEYKSAGRQYVVQAKAHNTVVVDGMNTDIHTRNIGKSGLTSYAFTKNISYVSGFHAMYAGVMCRRIVLYFKPNDFVVIDLIQGSKEHTFAHMLNIDSTISCELEGDTVIGTRNADNAFMFKTRSLLPNGQTISLHYGETGPEQEPEQGWMSHTYGKLSPCYTIQTSASGQDAVFATHISLQENDKLSDFHIEDRTISMKWGTFRIEILLTDFHEHLFINDKLYATQKFFRLPLMEALLKNEAERYKYIQEQKRK